VESTLETNKKFDAQGLIDRDVANKSHLKFWDNELCKKRPQLFDLIVSVSRLSHVAEDCRSHNKLGGDGTVLYASWLFQRIVPPVISFSLGSLGFLTKFDYNDYPQTLTHAFREGVCVSLRLRFEGTVMRSQSKKDYRHQHDLVQELVDESNNDVQTHQPDGTFEILNDIVVDRGPNPSEYPPTCALFFIALCYCLLLTDPKLIMCPHLAMSAIELFGDVEHFTTVQADGVCVATPTGSTAYNLAAGGSLCHPDNPVILVTAICAHTLNFRPIILPDTVVLRVGVPYDARTSSWASFDGRERVELRAGDYVTISASRYPFAYVLPPGGHNKGWVNSISKTLQWNSRQKQKSFIEWSKD